MNQETENIYLEYLPSMVEAAKMLTEWEKSRRVGFDFEQEIYNRVEVTRSSNGAFQIGLSDKSLEFFRKVLDLGKRANIITNPVQLKEIINNQPRVTLEEMKRSVQEGIAATSERIIKAVLKVKEIDYVPANIKLRAHIGSCMMTAEFSVIVYEELKNDPLVESINIIA